jgi:hypothetical protein
MNSNVSSTLIQGNKICLNVDDANDMAVLGVSMKQQCDTLNPIGTAMTYSKSINSINNGDAALNFTKEDYFRCRARASLEARPMV